MKKKYLVVILVVLAITLSISVSFADYDYAEYHTGSVGGRSFVLRNGISNDRRDAYAKTEGGTNTYNSVTANFYFMNYSTHQSGAYLNYGRSGSITAQIDAPELSYMQNIKYYEVNSSHSGSYEGVSFSYSGLKTLID